MATYDRAIPTRLGDEGQVTLLRGKLVRIALLLLAGSASACSGIERANDSKLSIDTPVEWWHDLQGGKIAEVRPPPPGVTDPYPNLGQVPPRPTLTDAATRRALAARLTAERDRTQREATQDPLVLPATAAVPASAPPSFSAAPRPAAAPADPGASVAVMDAATASAPPAVTAPPPEAFPSVTAPAVVAAPGVPEAAGPAAEALRTAKPAVEAGSLPDLPTSAPPLPRLGGLPATVNAPAVPRVPPGVTIAFAPGSATLPASADAALRELAGRRAGATIAVTAGGNAAGPGADAQARALPLALRRARAIQDALVNAGVPPTALRVDAAAMGRGGEARLLP